jgi:hypothetical protein
MDKCYVNVCGGVGNQLFQIANGFAYSKKYSKELYVNSSNWNASQGNHCDSYKDDLFKNFKYESPENNRYTILTERNSDFYELPFIDGDVVLEGYFQSLKYFDTDKDEFMSKLCLRKVDTSFIKEKNVAIHIRRGDYLRHSNVHLVCGEKYFTTMFKKFDKYQVNVFTDSPEYVLKEFDPYYFNLIQTSSELNDLTLMSKHDNIVCSNSSFSWWASILGKPKQRVIVPERWYNDRSCLDIYYEGMIKYAV